MATTTTKGFPYPEGTDAVDVAGDIQSLAEAVDNMPGVESLTSAEISALAVADKWAGRIVYNSTTGALQVSDGSTFSNVDTTTPLSTSTPSALGVAAAGSSTSASKGDHVHAMPTASDVAAIPNSLVSAAGQVIASSGSATPAIVPVGTADGHVLTWDAAESTKMKWAAASGGISDGSLATRLIMLGAQERWNVVASAATGTVNFDTDTSTVWYYTTAASANFTLNFRGDGSNTLASRLAVGDSVTAVFVNTVGTTAYHATAFQIDGSAVTPVWLNDSAPPSSLPTQSASYVDTYTLTILKTAATPTYTVLGAWSTYK